MPPRSPADSPARPQPRFDLGGRAALAAALLAAAVSLGVLPTPCVLPLAALAAGLAALAWRKLGRQHRSLFGPLYYYEMLRLGRSGRTVLLRCGYALLLLAVLWFVHAELQARATHNPLFSDITTRGLVYLAMLGETFTQTVLVLQNVVVIVLTPIYLAGAITDERNRGTLDFLLASHLEDHEIILGKLAARLTALATVLLAGLPVLALIQFWGGVSVYMIDGGFAATAMTLLHVGALSIWASVVNRHLLGAILTSYVCLLFTMGCCMAQPFYALANPFAFLIELDTELHNLPDPKLPMGWVAVTRTWATFHESPLTLTLSMAGAYALWHGAFTLLYLTMAIRQLRRRHFDTQEPDPEPIEAEPLSAELYHKAQAYLAKHPAGPVSSRRAVGDDAVWWRETHIRAGSLSETVVVLWSMLTIVFFLYWLIILVISLTEGVAGEVGATVTDGMVGFATVVGLIVPWAAVGFQAAGSVSRECEKRTLDQLLTLPLDRSEIFVRKWLAPLWRYGPTLLLPAAVWVTGVFTPALHPLGLVLLVGLAAVHLLFAATLGIWLSVFCRNTVQACIILGSVLSTLTFGPLLLIPQHLALFQTAFDPVRCWFAAGFSWQEVARDGPAFDEAVAGICLNMVMSIVLTVILWLSARERFRRL